VWSLCYLRSLAAITAGSGWFWYIIHNIPNINTKPIIEFGSNFCSIILKLFMFYWLSFPDKQLDFTIFCWNYFFFSFTAAATKFTKNRMWVCRYFYILDGIAQWKGWSYFHDFNQAVSVHSWRFQSCFCNAST
jgi:hypothetical protein